MYHSAGFRIRGSVQVLVIHFRCERTKALDPERTVGEEPCKPCRPLSANFGRKPGRCPRAPSSNFAIFVSRGANAQPYGARRRFRSGLLQKHCISNGGATEIRSFRGFPSSQMRGMVRCSLLRYPVSASANADARSSGSIGLVSTLISLNSCLIAPEL